MQRHGVDRASAQAAVDDLRQHRVFVNALYQVNIKECGEPFGPEAGPVLWLSIKRRDKEPIHDWRDLQRIKSELVGPECEAIELYPAESRVVDSANQFHLFAFVDPTTRVPLGFRCGRVLSGPDEAERAGAKQRAFS